jgi:hypothetical protein
MFCSLARAADVEQLTAESRDAVKALAGELKATLQASIQSAGPLQAIEVCNIQAPLLAAKVSTEKGMQVGRTSLRTRNDANAPDAWERAVLEQFEQRKSDGEAVTSLEYSEITRRNGERVFRYMKAIPTGELCLLCHGEHIPADVSTKLGALYPHDRATGFRKGDIRGAFTVSRGID